MSETKSRFFPLIRDQEWGARLNPADLAVNKVIAASTRTKARDYIDLLTIDSNLCPLGAIVMAASGKPPNYSPVRSIDEIRRKGLSIRGEDYSSIRGLPAGWTAASIRENLVAMLDRAESYVRNAPLDLVGILVVDENGIPAETYRLDVSGLVYRRATSESEVVPDLPEVSLGWDR
ncbi:hypothetical protein [Ensifer canadensis]|nr:hypothetical protein [Ensifer canadensis]